MMVEPDPNLLIGIFHKAKEKANSQVVSLLLIYLRTTLLAGGCLAWHLSRFSLGKRREVQGSSRKRTGYWLLLLENMDRLFDQEWLGRPSKKFVD